MKKEEYLQNLVSATNIFWKLAEANGYKPETFFAKAGINLNLLSDPQARVPSRKVTILWDALTKEIGDPCFAVKASEYWHPSYLYALGYSWLASRTLKEGFQKLTRYSKLISDQFSLSTVYTKHEVLILFQYHPQAQLNVARRIAALSIVVEMCKTNYGKDLTPLKITINLEQPICREELENHFKTEIIYSTGKDSIIFAHDDLNQLLPGANKQLVELNDQILTNYMRELDSKSLAQRVQLKIIDNLTSGSVTDDYIANTLHMSVRSLQRKLQNEGTTFGALFDETRKDLAEEYIKDSKTQMEEIAYLIGFAEYSSFSRAFKRWTGQPPSKRRREIINMQPSARKGSGNFR